MVTRVGFFLCRVSGDVLDIGGYNGTLHRRLEKIRPGRTWLLDEAKSCLPRSVQGDAHTCNMHFKQKFDTIVAGEIIEHLERPLVFLIATRKLLKSGGTLLISTPNCLSWLNRIFKASYTPCHTSLMSVPEIIQLLRKAGYKIKTLKTTCYTAESNYYSDTWWCQLKPVMFLIRSFINNFLPTCLKEQILISAQNPLESTPLK